MKILEIIEIKNIPKIKRPHRKSKYQPLIDKINSLNTGECLSILCKNKKESNVIAVRFRYLGYKTKIRNLIVNIYKEEHNE